MSPHRHPADPPTDRPTPESQSSFFRTFGFLVLPRFFDPAPLTSELDAALRAGLVSGVDPSQGGDIQFRYLPMMTPETPESLALLDRLEPVAAALLGGPVLPTRAKGVRYSGDTPWHADSTSPVRSIGFAAYLEPLTAETGALRVLPGSHHPDLAAALRSFLLAPAGTPPGAAPAAPPIPAHAIPTRPGDILAFDERLYHASSGGAVRHQWRLDYLLDPTDIESESHTKAYFEAIYPPDWDGGYDVDRFPTYGPAWRASPRPAAARLASLGIHDLAARHESFARSRSISS